MTPSAANGQAIAVMGAKGGVGTTTIACNLAAALQSSDGQRTLLVDFHLFLGDVGFRLGLEQSPTVMEYLHPTAASPPWSAVPRHRAGFSLLGLAPDLAHADHVDAGTVVRFLDSARAHFDRIVLDCGSDLTEASLAASRYADTRVIVVTEQRPALLGARRRLHVLRALDIPGELATGVINRSHPDSGIDPSQVERAIGLAIGAQVRNAWQDNQRALSLQQLLCEACPSAGVTRDTTQLANIVRR